MRNIILLNSTELILINFILEHELHILVIYHYLQHDNTNQTHTIQYTTKPN